MLDGKVFLSLSRFVAFLTLAKMNSLVYILKLFKNLDSQDVSIWGNLTHCVVEAFIDKELSHKEFWTLPKLKPQDSHVLGIREVGNTTTKHQVD